MSEQGSEAEELLRWRNFGEWLVRRRADLGYTQVYVVGRAGISVQNLVSLEHGGLRRRSDGPWILPNPQDDTLKALARIYRVSAEELFERVGRYADRPQTKRAVRRRAGLDRPKRRDRIAELERQNAALEERLRALEERVAKYEAGGEGKPQRR